MWKKEKNKNNKNNNYNNKNRATRQIKTIRQIISSLNRFRETIKGFDINKKQKNWMIQLYYDKNEMGSVGWGGKRIKSKNKQEKYVERC